MKKKNKQMKLKNDIIQKRQPGGATRKSQSPSTNLQLKGVWLLLARGAWIAFVLAGLVMLMLVLLASRGQGMIFCPFIMPVSCQDLAQNVTGLTLP